MVYKSSAYQSTRLSLAEPGPIPPIFELETDRRVFNAELIALHVEEQCPAVAR